jgi:hypothetical protein
MMSQDMPREGKMKAACYFFGTVVALLGCATMVMPNWQHIYAKGPANTGHAKLTCVECHFESPGTVRQQLQAKVYFRLGMRNTDVEFGHAKVGNQQCDTCHSRDQDSHPVHRFLEPRFEEARAELGVHLCVSCHREHTGVRSTLPETACSLCHNDLKLKVDPLDVPHHVLIEKNNWASCLGCHDYHNNHRRNVQKSVKQAYSPSVIKAYMDGGPSPYGTEKKYPTKEPK